MRQPLPLLDGDLLAELSLQLAQLAEDRVQLVVLQVRLCLIKYFMILKTT